ncbi:MAG: trypsin-like peptidase domain-containing protein [Clostridia bacterium]
MNEKVFIKEEKSDTLKLILVSVIVAILSSCCTYALFNYKNKDVVNGTNNVSYEIKEVSNPVVAIADKFKNSIVGIRIESMSTNIFGMLEDASSEASGIIYSNDGYIITNHHVIAEAIDNSSATIYVTLSNKKEPVKAKLIGSDSTTDLAVIKIEENNLQAAEIGVSKDIKVGELAVAIGNPLGQNFAGSVTSGIISAIDRKITTER